MAPPPPSSSINGRRFFRQILVNLTANPSATLGDTCAIQSHATRRIYVRDRVQGESNSVSGTNQSSSRGADLSTRPLPRPRSLTILMPRSISGYARCVRAASRRGHANESGFRPSFHTFLSSLAESRQRRLPSRFRYCASFRAKSAPASPARLASISSRNDNRGSRRALRSY